MGFRGAIFDVDGVLVDSPHEEAWREGLRQLMENDWSDIRGETSYSPEEFTPQVYQKEMSGKPRYDGAQAALEYFGVPDPEERAKEYGDRKQEMIVELIDAGEFHAYPDALRFLLAVKDSGMRIAAASSSKNANAFLERIRIDEFVEEEGLSYDFVRPGYTLLDTLDANVSGREFERGKPHPEIFLTAAEEAETPAGGLLRGRGRGQRRAGREGRGHGGAGGRALRRRGGAGGGRRGPRGHLPGRRLPRRAHRRPPGPVGVMPGRLVIAATRCLRRAAIFQD